MPRASTPAASAGSGGRRRKSPFRLPPWSFGATSRRWSTTTAASSSTPQIKVAENEAEFAKLAQRAELVHGLGYDHEELLDRRSLFEHLPALAPYCVGGLASMGDGFADPYRTTFAFRRKAESLGTRFFEGTRVTGLTPAGGAWRVETDRGVLAGATVVNCGGAWAHELAARVGEPVPLEAIAPMMMVTARLPSFCDAVVGATGRPLSFKQMPNGTVVIGGGRRGLPDTASNRTELRFSELAKTARTAAELFPVMRGSTIVRCWAGIEARMPDDLPVIGPSSTQPNLFHAFGFSAHGFQLGPAVGGIIAELVVNGRTNLPIEALRIDRFSTPPEREAVATR